MHPSFVILLLATLLTGASQAAAPSRFELRLAEYQPAAGLTEVTLESGSKIYFGRTLVTNDDVVQARVRQQGNEYSIAIEFGFWTGVQMLLATWNHVGRPIAILVNGQVMSAPALNSRLFNAINIDGGFSREEAESLVRELNTNWK
jgi:preprotein translocase subunit SecD